MPWKIYQYVVSNLLSNCLGCDRLHQQQLGLVSNQKKMIKQTEQVIMKGSRKCMISLHCDYFRFCYMHCKLVAMRWRVANGKQSGIGNLCSVGGTEKTAGVCEMGQWHASRVLISSRSSDQCVWVETQSVVWNMISVQNMRHSLMLQQRTIQPVPSLLVYFNIIIEKVKSRTENAQFAPCSGNLCPTWANGSSTEIKN